ncbi:YdcF family protein [Sabulicella rubraurantiaca]|uniref:YdcF family protein n=1 Tax=Sabulicella rubraurantiaca TaxID=2811429 RepID=UPI001A96E152|nr:YdcF family protein [Sabulicella rubraurantiaca]
MSLQAALTALVLPPLGFVLLAALLALWGRRGARIAAAACAGAVLILAMPFTSTWLLVVASRDKRPVPETPPGAIVVLGAEAARGVEGPEVGTLTLERLRAGAGLHRATELPVLVTGGVVSPNTPPIATLMARSLGRDFGIPVRWEEHEAGDTASNARASAALLKREGLDTVLLVTHGWHMPRARDSFVRAGMQTHPAPVRRQLPADGTTAGDWVPRPDHLLDSWYALREMLGRAVYAVRDGGAS